MVQERPGEGELAGEMRGERLHAERLGGVMPSVKHVQAEFLREGVGPMGAFAVRNVSTPSAAACRRSPPAPPVTTPMRRQTGGPPGRMVGAFPGRGEPFRELIAGDAGTCLPADEPSLACEEGLQRPETQGAHSSALLPSLGWASRGRCAL